jgi:tetratricopeptide (TPR) repeat protein
LLIAVAAWAGAVGLLRWHDARTTFEPRLGAPPALALRGLTSGYANVFADVLYLQFVQHFGRCLARRKQVVGAEPWLEQLTRLDPRFEGAYVIGSMALGDAGENEALERLWARAIAHRPGRWDVPYEAGMHLFLFGSRPDEYLRAARLFHLAASLPGAPREAHQMEARMYQVTGQRDLAIAVWRKTLRTSPSAEARAVAARTLGEWGVPLDEPSSR